MKITGKVVKHVPGGEIMVETEDGRRYRMPRMSAVRILGNGNVEFESLIAPEIRRGKRLNA